MIQPGRASGARAERLPRTLAQAGPRPAAVVETTAQRRRPSSGSSGHTDPRAAASCRRQRASPPSTRTAPYGSSTRCTPRWCTAWSACPAVVGAKTGAAERRALQDGPVRQPGGDGKLPDEGAGGDPRRHSHRHDGGRVQCRSDDMDREGEAPPLGPAVYRAGLPADARGLCATFAPTATRPTSSPAAARTSCACTPSRSTASHRAGRRQRADQLRLRQGGKPTLTKEPSCS